MASGWKGSRGGPDKSQGHKPTVGGHSSRSDSADRSEVPQRPPTVGQELPNNLVPALQDWQLDTALKPNKNRKKGNIGNPKEKHSKQLPPKKCGPLPRPISHSKGRMTASEAESASDGDFNSRDGMHGATTKRHPGKVDSHGGVAESDISRANPIQVSSSSKVLDTNQIVGKLVQIRDYIKQVACTIKALEHTRNPSVFDKLEKLRKVKLDLLENEHRLVELLQRVSVIQTDRVNEDSSNSEAESVASNQDGVLTNVDGTSEVSSDDSYNKQNELLQKVNESQEKLKELREQQALLMALQQKAEHRLVQARSFHDQLTSKTNGNEPSFLTVDEVNASHALETDLLNIQHRLDLLQHMQSSRERCESLERSVDGELRVPEKHSRAYYEKEYKELQTKLQDLESKKKQMDELLKELCHLRESQTEDANRSSPAASQNEGKPMTMTKDSLETVQQSLQMIDTNDKMRKLDEMKSWLYNMQEMVANFRPESTHESPADSHWQSNSSELSNLEQSRNVPFKVKRERKPKTDNLSREQSNESMARLAAYHGVHPNTEQGHRKDSTVDLSIEMHEQNLDEKARQLQATKAKLQKLQNLLSAVQQNQRSGQQMSAEQAEHLLNLIETEEDENFESPRPTNKSSSLSIDHGSQGDPVAHSSMKSVSKPTMNRAGKAWHSDATIDDPVNALKGSHGGQKYNSARNDPLPAIKIPDSNHDLWLEMRHQMALQEELRQRKRELECLMRKDGGKNYLLNQDTQSENFSVSAKSEPVLAAASVGATDLTSAATWGGSSVDNCARDTVDGNESQEDQNERIDNEEYSSEEPLEAENLTSSVNQSHDAGINKAINSSPGYHLDGSGAWGIVDHQRASTSGTANGDGYPVMSGNNLGHTKNVKQHPERTFMQYENFDAQAQDDQFGYDTMASLQLPLNLTPTTQPLQQQMEMATLLCQTILRDQNVLPGLIPQPSTSTTTTTVPLASSLTIADLAHQQHGQLVQQQLLLGLSHCYHLLYLQNLEIQRLRQMLQSPIPSGISYTDSHCSRMRTRTNESGDCPTQGVGSQWHPDNPSLARLSMSSSPSQAPFPQQQHSFPPHPSTLQEGATQGSTTETLNNQVPPGNRANNYWDNFRSYSRQNLLSSTASHPNKSNDCPGGHCPTLPRASSSILTAQLKMPCPRAQCNSSHSNEDLHAGDLTGTYDAALQSRLPDNQARGAHGSSASLQGGGGIMPNPAKDKINKDISSLTMSPNLLKNCDKSSTNSAMPPPSGIDVDALQTGPLGRAPAKQDCNKTNMGARERVTQNVAGKSRPPTNSLSDPLEASVYDEVSKLVSQFNESPHYLIQLLRELRKLNSDKAAHDALQALHGASSSISHCDVEGGPAACKPFVMQTGSWIGGGAKPRQSKRENSSSSDDEDDRTSLINRRRDVRHPPTNAQQQFEASTNSSKSRLPSNRNIFEQLHAREMGEQALSRPTKSLTSDRKCDKSADWQLPTLFSLAHKQDKPATGYSQGTPHARINDASVSDASSSRFNLQQLENQMKSIMSSIALFVSSFAHHICNPNLTSTLSSHIFALVLPFLHNYNQDTPGQLTGILESIIQKYSGKRIGDVEESLLSDLSDVLFNELVFFQLLHNMDGNSAQLRLQKFHSWQQKLVGQTREMAGKPERGGNPPRDLPLAEIKLPVSGSPTPLCTGGHSEATDADLVVMARRGDDENNDKGHEDFSCDIPDVCAGRGGMTGAGNSIVGDEVMGFRASHHNPLVLDSHSMSPPPLPDLGALAAAAEGQGEGNYFDQEVEMESEGLGDTQDLAEADQSQGYMEAESALDDVQEGEHFQAWGVDHVLMNGGGIDRTEDDQHNEDDPLGAAGGAPEFPLVDQSIIDISRTELGLDEVPIKLRDGISSGNANGRERSKEDAIQESPEYDDIKAKRSDHNNKP